MARKSRITLFHNENAGEAGHDRAALVKLLSEAGFKVSYNAAKRCDIPKVLDDPADLIVVAGGDGAVARVTRHAHPEGPPIAVLPLGTANNIAKSLGIEGSVEELIAGWEAMTLRPFYPIDISGPWGSGRLAEGIGFGVLEHCMGGLAHKPPVDEAQRAIAACTAVATPEFLQVTIDNETLAGPFALLEITTLPLVGPNLCLAPKADPSEQRLSICFAAGQPDERHALSQWLTEDEAAGPAPVEVLTGERIAITGRFTQVRLDDKLWPRKPDGDLVDIADPIKLRSAAEPLQFVVPPKRTQKRHRPAKAR